MPTQLWIPDRDDSRSPPRLWNPKYFSHFGFRSAEKCCEHAPEPFGTTSKQQVLHGWVNRPSTDNRDASKVSVGHCQLIGMKAEDTQHWSLFIRPWAAR
jgi:hypothetical protein